MTHPTRKILRDYTITVVIAVAAAMLIRNYLLEAYRIPSQSMKPTLLAGDTLFVTKWPRSIHRLEMPKRGEIIVFKNFSQSALTGHEYIRRVVGLPGDTVALKNGHLFLNGASLTVAEKGRDHLPNNPCFQEKFPDGVPYPICSEGTLIPDFGPEKVPENFVFTMEDSRTETPQRKGWGLIPLPSILGKANWIWLSIEPNDLYSENQTRLKWIPRFRFNRMFRSI